jgi:hypothetical protein
LYILYLIVKSVLDIIDGKQNIFFLLKTLGIKPNTNNTTAQAASGEVPSVKSDSAKSSRNKIS